METLTPMQRYRQNHPDRVAASQRRYNETHRTEQVARTQEWRTKQEPGRQTDYDRLRFYGMSREQFDEMLEAQSGRCAICGEAKKLCVDHDHASGRIRGLLCTRCNTGLGKMGDTIEGLQRAISYLQRCEEDE